MARFSRSRFLLSSAVLTRPGTYEYHLVSVDEARAWLSKPYASRLRFSVTADAIELLLGIKPPLDRTPVEMRPGDEALVARLTFDVNREQRALTAELVAQHFELGLLTRLSRAAIEGEPWQKSESNSKSTERM